MTIDEASDIGRFFSFELHSVEVEDPRATLDSDSTTDHDDFSRLEFSDLGQVVAPLDEETFSIIYQPDSWPWRESFPEMKYLLRRILYIYRSKDFVDFGAVSGVGMILGCW